MQIDGSMEADRVSAFECCFVKLCFLNGLDQLLLVQLNGTVMLKKHGASSK